MTSACVTGRHRSIASSGTGTRWTMSREGSGTVVVGSMSERVTLTLEIESLDRELEQQVAQLWQLQAGGLPQLGEVTGRGEARQRVDLIHQDPIVVDEEVDARQSRAAHV